MLTSRIAVPLMVTSAALGACGTGPATNAGTRAKPTPSVTPAAQDPLLRDAWEGYKHDFIRADGRVVDPDRNATTSEGQSYAMLRAAWMGDEATFDSTWRWTQSNLQVRGDHLFGWLWGPSGLMDRHSATDADQDIALALVFAARRFGKPAHAGEARALLSDIWTKDVATVGGVPVPTAGDWAPTLTDPGTPFNPSYFSPYAYRVFAAADPAHPWDSLVDGAYTALDRCTKATLGGKAGVGLPPNWCALDSGLQAHSYQASTGGDNYSYDAFRTFWRLSLDATWNHEARATSALRAAHVLWDRAKSGSEAAAPLSHGGDPVGGADPTFYAGVLPVAMELDQAGAAQLLANRLLPLVHRDGAPVYFDRRTNYYEANWAWFAIALGRSLLPNLAA